MKFEPTPLAGSYLIQLEPRVDERGAFARTFCKREFAAAGLDMDIVQSNESVTRTRGTLRGLHYQVPPHAEVKVVRCIRGAVFDVIVDLRRGSRTLGQSFTTRLSEGDGRMVVVPRGFAHGFLTLEDHSTVHYLVSEFYTSTDERGVRWDDATLAIPWPFSPIVISSRDQALPAFGSDTPMQLV